MDKNRLLQRPNYYAYLGRCRFHPDALESAGRSMRPDFDIHTLIDRVIPVETSTFRYPVPLSLWSGSHEDRWCSGLRHPRKIDVEVDDGAIPPLGVAKKIPRVDSAGMPGNIHLRFHLNIFVRRLEPVEIFEQ
jgi:hypothetical protein